MGLFKLLALYILFKILFRNLNSNRGFQSLRHVDAPFRELQHALDQLSSVHTVNNLISYLIHRQDRLSTKDIVNDRVRLLAACQVLWVTGPDYVAELLLRD